MQTTQPLKRFWYLFKVAITFVVLGVIVKRLDMTQAWQVFQTTQITWYGLAILVSFLVPVVGAYAISFVLKATRHRLPFLAILKINYVSGFFSFLGDITGNIVRWATLSGQTGRRGEAFFVMVVERLQLILVYTFLTVIAWFAEPGILGVLETWVIGISLTVLGGAAVGILSLFFSAKGMQALTRLIADLKPKAIFQFPLDRVRDLDRVSKHFRSNRRYFLISQLLMVLYAGVSLMTFSFVMHSIGIEPLMLNLLLVFALTNIVEQIPITIRGIGLREGILIFLLSKYGIINEVSLVLGMLLFLLCVWQALLGGVWHLMSTVKEK